LQQLEAIPERICDVYPVMILERVVHDLDAGLPKTVHQEPEVAHEQGRVCLPCGAEVWFDSEVNLHRVILEPCATAFGERRRLDSLGDTQQAGEDPPRLALATGRHGKLDMVDTDDHRIANRLTPCRLWQSAGERAATRTLQLRSPTRAAHNLRAC